jgi:hypothetical protein
MLDTAKRARHTCWWARGLLVGSGPRGGFAPCRAFRGARALAEGSERDTSTVDGSGTPHERLYVFLERRGASLGLFGSLEVVEGDGGHAGVRGSGNG